MRIEETRFVEYHKTRKDSEMIPKIYLELMMRDFLHYTTEDITQLSIVEYHAAKVYCIMNHNVRIPMPPKKKPSTKPETPGVDPEYGVDPKALRSN